MGLSPKQSAELATMFGEACCPIHGGGRGREEGRASVPSPSPESDQRQGEETHLVVIGQLA